MSEVESTAFLRLAAEPFARAQNQSFTDSIRLRLRLMLADTYSLTY